MAVMSNMVFFLVLLSAAVLLYFPISGFLRGKKGLGAVPPISSNVPFIGHILGIMRHKNGYYLRLRAKYPFPIYSLDLLGKKMYIVNSPDLMVSIQRNWKKLQFAPIASRFLARICHLSPRATKILMAKASLDKGDESLYSETLKAIHTTVGSGSEGLEHMSRIAIRNVCTSLDSLAIDTGPVRLNLAFWLRHEITLATSEAIYGPANPFRDPNVEDGFWAMEDDLTMLALNWLPAVTARTGHKGRAVCIEAFKQYFVINDHETGSALVKARVEACHKYNVPVGDIASLEIAGILAALENTMPTAFWMLFYVFSSPSILADLRFELENILQTTEKSLGETFRTLDVTAMKGKCPLLHSIFQETLRHRSCGVSVRVVLQDTLLNDKFAIEAGCMIQMPSRVVHDDPAIWGPTVKDFDPRRFLRGTTKEPQEHKAPAAAFRAFGGGTTLCPGRHFASTEVLCIVAMFALRYDIDPVCGDWRMPPPKNQNIVASTEFPGVDVEVDVRPREGYEDGSWGFQLGESQI